MSKIGDRDTKDAKIVMNGYQQREWLWKDGHREPYSVAVPPSKRKRPANIADGVKVDDPFIAGLYEREKF